jgi:hypothetical protein
VLRFGKVKYMLCVFMRSFFCEGSMLCEGPSDEGNMLCEGPADEGNMRCEGPSDEGCKQRGSSTLNELRSRNYQFRQLSGGIKPTVFPQRSSWGFRNKVKFYL